MGRIGSVDSELDEKTYKFYLDDLLKERPWVFTLARGRGVSLTSDGPDLGYTYKYRLNASDVIEVLDINPEKRFNSIFLVNPREALRFGLAVDFPGESFLAADESGFLYVDGILHTDREVNEYVYRRTVTPSSMSPDFRLLLIFTLALRYTLGTHENPTRRQELKAERRAQHTKAAYADMQPPSDPYYRLLYQWVRHFYQDSYIRR